MAAVGIRDAVKYGFVLIGYLILVIIGGGVIAWVGSFMIGFGVGRVGGIGGLLLALIGLVVLMLGILIIYGLFFGASYKMMADAVKRGIESSSGFDGTERTTNQQSRGSYQSRNQDSFD